mgnify:CR=1 FL=1
MKFSLESPFKPTGDQPQAIAQIVDGILEHAPSQTLVGVTGSGKTFTIANVIAESQRPTLILAPNKTPHNESLEWSSSSGLGIMVQFVAYFGMKGWDKQATYSIASTPKAGLWRCFQWIDSNLDSASSFIIARQWQV